jgi:hypothetical protein
MKREQYNLSQKAEDSVLKAHHEKLYLHLAVVDLVAACARMSPFCIAQAQKLIEAEELLDSIMTDAVPFVVKKHYFHLMYEVYLRKVEGLSPSHRLRMDQLKLVQIFRWVIEYDIEHSYNFYLGLIMPAKETDPPDVVRKTKQVKRDINRIGEQEYDLLDEGKT